jgi:hypothetical protein
MGEGNEGKASGEGKSGSTISNSGSDKLMTKHLATLIAIHEEISEIEQLRYKKKWNPSFTNAIQGLGTVTGELSTYLYNRKKEDIYGTEKIEESI